MSTETLWIDRATFTLSDVPGRDVQWNRTSTAPATTTVPDGGPDDDLDELYEEYANAFFFCYDCLEAWELDDDSPEGLRDAIDYLGDGKCKFCTSENIDILTEADTGAPFVSSTERSDA